MIRGGGMPRDDVERLPDLAEAAALDGATEEMLEAVVVARCGCSPPAPRR
jgi:hypothetical protein